MRTNSSLLEEAVYAMGALAGDPPARTRTMELHKKGVARHPTLCVFRARKQLRHVRVD
jgi:hypothetical protein